MAIVAGYTNKGKRENNEDSFFAGENFAIVADGMGGHRKGEVASFTAVEHIKECLSKLSEISINSIEDAIISANKLIMEKAAVNESMGDMGTTVVMCAWNKNTVYIANVGDSRCYLCTRNRITQITTDHSYVQTLVDSGQITPEEAETRADKNLILRAVGCEERIDVDTFELSVKKGDMLILCSDGLSGVVSDADIKKISQKSGEIKDKVKLLVDEAYNNGGTDNITAVIVQF